MKRATKRLISAGLALALMGCHTATLPDPNDPVNASAANLEEVQTAIKGIYENLEARVESRQITQAQLHEELVKRTAEFANQIDLDSVPMAEAWRAGEIFRTAEQWPQAESAYTKATIHPLSSDRRVNDTLHLALCRAHTGKIMDAITLPRTVFDTPAGDKGAILPAILLEIAPAVEGKGHDAELARLLVDAVKQHLMVVIDPRSDPGKAFLMARPYHIRNALDLASRLLWFAGHQDESRQVDRFRRDALQAVMTAG